MSTHTVSPPLPGLLYAQAREYQDRLQALEEGAADELARYWVQAQGTIQRDLDALLARVGEATAGGERLSPSWASREARYRQALATAQEQADLFGRTAARVVTATQETAATMAATSSASLGSAALASAQVGATFTGINPDNLRYLAGFLADGSPVADLLGSLGQDALPRLRQVLGDGIVLGRGVDRIRRDVLAAVDVPRWRADTIVRTEAHRVFRAASTETYAANADVLTGWTWLAALDSRTCPGCIAMHGTVHPVTATLDGHPRCRCTMVPLPEGATMALQPGPEWLAGQPERTQRAVLGPGKFAAYQRGDLDLRALAARTEDPRWGTMRREATLSESLENTRALRRNPQALTTRDAAPVSTARQWDRWEFNRDAEVTRPGQLPFNPENPLAVYGNRLNVADRTDVAATHLADLEKFSPEVHRVLADHYAGTRDGGMYVGDKTMPELDGLGHLAGVQPRGWPPGKTWDDVPGGYDSSRRVCACGGGGQGHGATSLALHEGSHALDHALSRPSSHPVFAQAVEQYGDALRLRPYFTKAGNPSGFASEVFAEGHAAMSASRAAGRSADDVARDVVRALGGSPTNPNAVPFGLWLVQNYDALVRQAVAG